MKRNVTFDKTLPKNLPLLFQVRAKELVNVPVQASKNKSGEFIYHSYEKVYTEIVAFAAALREIGIQRNDHVGLISDNRREWLITDFGILSLGAADVPRGCDSMGNEIRYILSFADCTHSFFENEYQLKKLLEKTEEAPNVKTVILFDRPSDEIIEKAKSLGITVYVFENLLLKGQEIIKSNPEVAKEIEAEMEKTTGDDIATLIFTSGTTGTPKGVMLSHRNFLAQMEIMHNILPVKAGDFWLSVLPVWHSFERAIQYVAITLKSGLAYSKPVAAAMLPDMQKIKPQWMCGVPRLWEALAAGVFRAMRKEGGIKYKLFNFFVAIGKKYCWARDMVRGRVCQFKKRARWLDTLIGIIPFVLLWPLDKIGDILVFSKIRQKFGGNFHSAISGGGALQKDIDAFYRAINFQLLEGYGMTETAPILSVRDFRTPRPGCVGVILPCSNIKIVAENHGEIISRDPLPAGKRGLIMAKGEQVMKGYYKRQDLTDLILDEDGWLNTGDLGMLTLDNEIKITGRAKDTIVLLGGENIEPAGIESAMCGSDYIESSIILGQDRKFLAALIVPAKDMIETFASNNGVGFDSYETLLESPEIKNLIQTEIDRIINAENGFRTCERVFCFSLIGNSFKVGEELSAKQEYMRHKINAKYADQIAKLFQDK